MADLSVAPKVVNESQSQVAAPGAEVNDSPVKNVSAKEKRDDIQAVDLTEVQGTPLVNKAAKEEDTDGPVKSFLKGAFGKAGDAINEILDRNNDGKVNLDDAKVVINDAKGLLKTIAGLAKKADDADAVLKILNVLNQVDNAVLGDMIPDDKLPEYAAQAEAFLVKIVELNNKANGASDETKQEVATV